MCRGKEDVSRDQVGERRQRAVVGISCAKSAWLSELSRSRRLVLLDPSGTATCSRRGGSDNCARIAPELRRNCTARHLHRREDAANMVIARGLHVVSSGGAPSSARRGGHVLAVGADQVTGPSVDLLRELEFKEDAEEVRREEPSRLSPRRWRFASPPSSSPPLGRRRSPRPRTSCRRRRAPPPRIGAPRHDPSSWSRRRPNCWRRAAWRPGRMSSMRRGWRSSSRCIVGRTAVMGGAQRIARELRRNCAGVRESRARCAAVAQNCGQRTSRRSR